MFFYILTPRKINVNLIKRLFAGKTEYGVRQQQNRRTPCAGFVSTAAKPQSRTGLIFSVAAVEVVGERHYPGRAATAMVVTVTAFAAAVALRCRPSFLTFATAALIAVAVVAFAAVVANSAAHACVVTVAAAVVTGIEKEHITPP